MDGIALSWDDEARTVVRVDYSGRWTWDQYYDGVNGCVEMMKSVSGRVDVIENMKPGMLPVSGSALTHARATMRAFPDNVGLVVVVTNPYVRAIGTIFVGLNGEYRAKVVLTDTLEQARAIILEQRTKSEA